MSEMDLHELLRIKKLCEFENLIVPQEILNRIEEESSKRPAMSEAALFHYKRLLYSVLEDRELNDKNCLFKQVVHKDISYNEEKLGIKVLVSVRTVLDRDYCLYLPNGDRNKEIEFKHEIDFNGIKIIDSLNKKLIKMVESIFSKEDTFDFEKELDVYEKATRTIEYDNYITKFNKLIEELKAAEESYNNFNVFDFWMENN